MEFYYHETDRDVLVLNADREIDSHLASRAVEDLQRLIENGARKLVIDCSRLGYVSSMGIATFMRLYKRLAEHDGHLRLVAVQGPLARLLEITRLNQVFEIHTTIDDAVRAFRNESTSSTGK